MSDSPELINTQAWLFVLEHAASLYRLTASPEKRSSLLLPSMIVDSIRKLLPCSGAPSNIHCPRAFLSSHPTLHQACGALALVVKPIGQRIAIYTALVATAGDCDQSASGCHQSNPRAASSTVDDLGSLSREESMAMTVDLGSTIGTSWGESQIFDAPPVAAESKRLIQICRQQLHSRVEDSLIQIHRPHTVTKRVFRSSVAPPHVFGGVAPSSSKKGPASGILDGASSSPRVGGLASMGASPSSPISSFNNRTYKPHHEVGGGCSATERPFTWIDVTGKFTDDAAAGAKDPGTRSATGPGDGRTTSLKSFSLVPRSRRHNSALSGRGDLTSLEDYGAINGFSEGDPLLASGPSPCSAAQADKEFAEYDGHRGGPKSALQHSSLEECLLQLESEFSIEIPLAAVVAKAQSMSMECHSDPQQQKPETTTRRRSTTNAQQVLLRSCVEHGIHQGYISGSVFSTNTSSADHQPRKRGSMKSSATAVFKSAEKISQSSSESKLQDEEEDAEKGSDCSLEENLQHQHVFVFDSPTSFISPEVKREIFPPNGSEQRSNANKESKNFTALALDAFLNKKSSKGIGPLTELWVVYVDFARNIVVSVRPTDCPSVSKMRSAFNELYGCVGLNNFLSFLAEACSVNYSAYLSEVYDLIDECETLVAPSMVERTRIAALMPMVGKAGEESNKAGTNTTTQEERERRRRHNVTQGQGRLSLVLSLATRALRSLWRKVVRRRTLPRDLTIATLRLMNLIYQQCSVCRRSLDRSKSIIITLQRVQLEEANMSNAEQAREGVRVRPEAAKAGGGLSQRRFLNTSAAEQSAAVSTSRKHGGKSEKSQHRNHAGDVGAEGSSSFDETSAFDSDQAVKVIKYINEMIEKVAQVRHISGELMNLSMALHGEFYDQGLSIVACIAAIFIPISWVNGAMSMNFYCVITNQKSGYFVLLGVYVVFVTLVLRFLFRRLSGSE
jgi:Mg2+ and Co2+ transporter CorA